MGMDRCGMAAFRLLLRYAGAAVRLDSEPDESRGLGGRSDFLAGSDEVLDCLTAATDERVVRRVVLPIVVG